MIITPSQWAITINTLVNKDLHVYPVDNFMKRFVPDRNRDVYYIMFQGDIVYLGSREGIPTFVYSFKKDYVLSDLLKRVNKALKEALQVEGLEND